MLRPRCGWVGGKPHFIAYHDRGVGVPVHDDRKHFRDLAIGRRTGGSHVGNDLAAEGWLSSSVCGVRSEEGGAILRQRKSRLLLKDPGIIRNRLKIDSAVTNAQAFLTVQEEFGSFDRYIWQFVGGAPIVNRWAKMAQDCRRQSAVSFDVLSKDLKKRGFRFVGSTIVYAHLQAAAGLVNDHTT